MKYFPWRFFIFAVTLMLIFVSAVGLDLRDDTKTSLGILTVTCLMAMVSAAIGIRDWKVMRPRAVRRHQSGFISDINWDDEPERFESL